MRRIVIISCVVGLAALLAPGAIAAPAALAATTGSISGTVTQAGTATAAPNVCVYGFGESTGSTPTTTTAANGTYTLSGLAQDSYEIFFDPSCDGTVPSTSAWQYYPLETNPEQSVLVTVGSGAAVLNINAVLATGTTVSGLTMATGGSPVGDICVDFYLETTGDINPLVAEETTAADGTYSLTSFPNGDYFVEFDPTCSLSQSSPYAIQWRNGTANMGASSPIVIANSGEISGVDATLVAGSSISGMVSTPGAEDAANVCVVAYSATDGYLGNLAVTGVDGTYAISNLPVGYYKVTFEPSCDGLEATDFAPSWYNGELFFTAGLTVSLPSPGSAQANINTSLSLAPNVSPLSISPSPLPNASLSSSYSAKVSASGGTGPYEWAASGLPAGLSMDPSTGTISGTPTASGSFTVSVTVTDAAAQPLTATTLFSLSIPQAVSTPTIVAPLATTPAGTGTTPAGTGTTPSASETVCSFKTKTVTIDTTTIVKGKRVTLVSHKSERVYKTVTTRKVETIHGKKVVVVTHKLEPVKVCKTIVNA